MPRRFSRRRFLRLAAAAVAAAAVTYGVERELIHHPHCLWGAYVHPQGGTGEEGAITDFERMIGRRLAITRLYTKWDVRLPTGVQQWAARSGRIPLISWNSQLESGADVMWASIASGSQDSWIAEQAARFKMLGLPVWMAFNHEPEGDPQRGTPADYVAAWERVKSVFDSAGADNVTWLVTLTASTFDGARGGPEAWMPSSYDLLGADGYNRAPCYPGTTWRSFEEIFASARDFAVRAGKGLVIQETGTLEQTDCGNSSGDPDAKARWFTDMGATIKRWPEVRAVEYSHTKARFHGYPMAFWVDTSPQSLAAYKAVGLDPYFS